ncbi:hypothetical protein [Micromonospora cathayae]|uniref:Uncharacterized protein n=1 Tax=Micromonospora cathayae TaxID=3028804 RepID=A0ABY7ZL53_9ACTN|nr:hypothetical protein [Micromonospora sp. HUAS 3]WDZ83022.1 hypothetical protein PVK37_21445 [Micromonospora sp. HUAS 3]
MSDRPTTGLPSRLTPVSTVAAVTVLLAELVQLGAYRLLRSQAVAAGSYLDLHQVTGWYTPFSWANLTVAAVAAVVAATTAREVIRHDVSRSPAIRLGWAVTGLLLLVYALWSVWAGAAELLVGGAGYAVYAGAAPDPAHVAAMLDAAADRPYPLADGWRLALAVAWVGAHLRLVRRPDDVPVTVP